MYILPQKKNMDRFDISVESAVCDIVCTGGKNWRVIDI